MNPLPSIRDLEMEGRTMFLRLDLNVPLTGGAVEDTTRIEAVLPTLGHCLKKGAAVVAASHLGRPGGRPDPELSLRPVAESLQTLLGWPVAFLDEVVGEGADDAKAALEPGELLLLENLRFHPGEEANDRAFAEDLARGCDLYATDAFAALHRAHASVVGVPAVIGGGAAGFLVERELEVLDDVLERPESPFVLILGGAKISTKLPVLRNLSETSDRVLVGGAMALTLLAARGEELGASLVESERLEEARSLLDSAEASGRELLLPEDHVVSGPEGQTRTATTPLGPQDQALDIGPATRERFIDGLQGAGTVLWNGPLGKFEEQPFDQGTLEVGRAVAACGGRTVVGGGDSIAALGRMDLLDRIDHVCTGGGAMLEFLAGGTLPGLEAIRA